MENEIEKWLPVVGHEGSYEVSNLGRVRSLDRVISIKQPPWTRRKKGVLLKPGKKKSGHVSVVLGREFGSKDVHVLVAEAFLGPKPDGMECLHWDDNPENNTDTNLRWGTRRQNLHDAIRTGKKPVGEDWWISKLKNEDIPIIRSLFGKKSYEEIGRIYGVSGSAIRQIKNGRSWRHINGDS